MKIFLPLISTAYFPICFLASFHGHSEILEATCNGRYSESGSSNWSAQGRAERPNKSSARSLPHGVFPGGLWKESLFMWLYMLLIRWFLSSIKCNRRIVQNMGHDQRWVPLSTSFTIESWPRWNDGATFWLRRKLRSTRHLKMFKRDFYKINYYYLINGSEGLWLLPAIAFIPRYYMSVFLCF